MSFLPGQLEDEELGGGTGEGEDAEDISLFA
jgi:hypothetical protein